MKSADATKGVEPSQLVQNMCRVVLLYKTQRHLYEGRNTGCIAAT